MKLTSVTATGDDGHTANFHELHRGGGVEGSNSVVGVVVAKCWTAVEHVCAENLDEPPPRGR